MEFQIGDVVILKSGGPSMTISMILNENSEEQNIAIYNALKMRGFTGTVIHCTWFDEPTNDFKKDFFKESMLKKV